MTQDEFVRLMVESGLARYVQVEKTCVSNALQRFATLVAAHEREKQAEQEPVAWWFQPPNKNVRPMFDTQQHGGKWKPLYAAPVRTKDLTDDEIEMIFKSHIGKQYDDFARAVISADREKNK